MTKQIDKWEDINWAKAEADVFRVQRRIFNASKGEEHANTHQLQALLLSSFHAKCLAVRKVGWENQGRHTSGVDGVRSLTKPQMWKMANTLDINAEPSPLRRVNIPKANGKMRPLSIPTMTDRARQTLIAMILEPQWEPRLPPHMFGFRRGRSTHDAVANIRQHIQRSPKWLLDADIASFFDNVDREALMGKLDTLPCIRRAIRRMLQSRVVENLDWISSDTGIPQGGGLSPLLGNIVLSGIEDALTKAFPPTHRINGHKIGKPPRVVIYADDLVVFHDRRDVIDEAKAFLTEWLAGYGLHLNEEKTRVTHTLDTDDGSPGFDFLGYSFRQHRVGKHQLSPWFNGVLTLITPSPKAVKALKEKISGIIMSTRPHPKHNAAYAQQKAKGRQGHQERLIHELNPILRGWGNQFRFQNSKETFTGIDNWLYKKLWQWTNRHYGKLHSRHELVNRFFNGGNPWTFKAKAPATGKPTELLLLRTIKVGSKEHTAVQTQRSYYDGNFIYWVTRRGGYPGIATGAATILKKQHGKCARCAETIIMGERLTMIRVTGEERQFQSIIHHNCMISTDKEGGRITSGRECQ